MSSPPLQLTVDYIAGLFDGEGWLSFGRRREGRYIGGFQYQATGGLTMREQSIVIALWDRYGGSMSTVKPKMNNHSMTYRWHMTGDSLRVFLLEVGPLLIAKKRQASLLIDYLGSGLPRGRIMDGRHQRQLDLYDEMKTLNQRGIGKV